LRRTTVLLLVVATLVTPVAVAALWLRLSLLDQGRYVHTVAPLGKNPVIVSVVAGEVTDGLLAQVDASALENELGGKLGSLVGVSVRGYVEELVAKLLLTSEFQALWRTAVVQSHEPLIAALEGHNEGRVDVNLGNLVAAARRSLVATGLDVFDRVEPGLVQEHFTLVRPGALHRAPHAVSLLKTLSIVLPVAAIALVGLAFALSRDRRRTLMQTGIALVAAGVIGLFLVVGGRTYYLHSVVGPDVPHAAANALYDTVVRDLRRAYKILCAAGLVAIVAALLAGPSRTAVRARSLTLRGAGAAADAAVGESVTLGWVAANKSTLRTVAVVAGLLFLITSGPLGWALLLEVSLGVAIALGAIEVLARPGS
jgi:hypothetical protein